MEEPSNPAVTPVKTHWFIKLDFWCTHYFGLLWVPFWGELVYVGGWYGVSPEEVNHMSPCMKAKVRQKALLLYTVELGCCGPAPVEGQKPGTHLSPQLLQLTSSFQPGSLHLL